MFRVSLRFTVLLAVLAWPAVASANHHHIGGSGSGGGDDPNADCLVWGYIVADGGGVDRVDAADDAATDADADAGMTDAGSGADAAQPVDAGTGDGGAGPPPGAVLVCLEHATLFGCDCSAGPAAAAKKGWSLGAVALVTAMLVAARRRRRRASPGGTR